MPLSLNRDAALEKLMMQEFNVRYPGYIRVDAMQKSKKMLFAITIIEEHRGRSSCSSP